MSRSESSGMQGRKSILIILSKLGFGIKKKKRYSYQKRGEHPARELQKRLGQGKSGLDHRKNVQYFAKEKGLAGWPNRTKPEENRGEGDKHLVGVAEVLPLPETHTL